MRLDEWQKYIDTQFLDDSPEPAPQSAPAPASTPQPPAAVGQTALSLDAAAVHAELAPPSLPVAVAVPTGAHDSNTPPPLADTPDVNDSAALPAKSKSGQSSMVLPASVGVSETALLATDSAHEADTAFPEPALSVTHSVFTLVVTPPPAAPAPSNRSPRIELLTPLPDAPGEPASAGAEVVNKTRRRSQARAAQQNASTASAEADAQLTASAPAASSDELFQPLNDLGADIPEFARYLPSSHAAAPSVSPQHIVSEPAALPSAQALPPSPGADHHPHDTPRHVPRSRARHARNVRPEPVSSGSSAAELWAAVPRHVQTLLSLERIEEENEIAQSSYKRPFQEKRHELIERLLDPILSLEDTARLLNVCPTTVRRYTNKGILTYYRKDTQRSANGSEAGGKSEEEVKDRTNGDGEIGEKEIGEKETRQRRFRLSDILAFLETQQSVLSADSRTERRARLNTPVTQDPGSNGTITAGAAKDA